MRPLKQRLTINSPIESCIQRHCPDRVPLSAPLTFLPTSVNIALNIAATEIFKWVTGDRQSGIEGKLISYDARSTEIDKHVVIKRPQCQSCGERDAIDRQPQPIQLEHRSKTLINDGGYRICSPAETLKQMEHHHSGSFDGDEIRHKHSYRSLGELAIHPNRCMQFSPTQYQQRQSWNQDCTGWFQKVPAPFDEESIVEWTPVWSLTDRTFKYLPTAPAIWGSRLLWRLLAESIAP